MPPDVYLFLRLSSTSRALLLFRTCFSHFNVWLLSLKVSSPVPAFGSSSKLLCSHVSHFHVARLLRGVRSSFCICPRCPIRAVLAACGGDGSDFPLLRKTSLSPTRHLKAEKHLPQTNHLHHNHIPLLLLHVLWLPHGASCSASAWPKREGGRGDSADFADVQ